MSTGFNIAFNSAWHEATKTTPANLFFGRQLNHSLELRWKLDELLAVPRGSNQIRNEWQTAVTNLKLARQRRERLYDQNRLPNPFKSGDSVMNRGNRNSGAVCCQRNIQVVAALVKTLRNRSVHHPGHGQACPPSDRTLRA